MATQNPIGSIGTSMLPESQLDRFMMRLSMGYPDSLSEVRMLKSKEGNEDIISGVNSVVTMNEVLDIQNEVAEVYVHDDIYAYIVAIVNATRKNENILLGVSPRGTIAIVNAAKAMAYIYGRNYVIPDDVKEIINPVINHRIILSGKARAAHISVEQIIGNILAGIRIAVK